MSDPFERLLAVPGSELARRLRAGLELVEAALRDAARTAPADDPGADVYPEVRDHLRGLLSLGPPQAWPPARGPFTVPPAPAVSPVSLVSPVFQVPRRRADAPAGVSPAGGGTGGGFSASRPDGGEFSANRPGDGGFSAERPRDGGFSAGRPGVVSGPTRHARDPRLELAEAFNESPEAAVWTGTHRGEAGEPDEIWRRFCLDLLRLPASVAHRWQSELSAYDGTGGDWIDLPASGTEAVLIPPWPAAGVPGLRLLRGAPLDPEVARALGDAPSARELGALCTLLLRLAELDGELLYWRALVTDSTPRLADHEPRRQLRLFLRRRLREYARAGSDDARLFRLIDVDEDLRSTVHLPIPASDSWWHGLWDSSWRLLTRARERVPGASLRRMELTGLQLAEVGRLTRDNIRVTGAGGIVLHCLRVYVKVNDDRRPGRVVYGAGS